MFIYSHRRVIAVRTVVIMTPKVLMLIFDAALLVLAGALTAAVAGSFKLADKVLVLPGPVLVAPEAVAPWPVLVELLVRPVLLVLVAVELPPPPETVEIGKPPFAHFSVKSDKRKKKKIRLQTFDQYRQTCILFTLSLLSDFVNAPMETTHCKHVSKPSATEPVHRH